jgi:hypothetical protein
MLKKRWVLTKTTQSRSNAYLCKAGNDLHIGKPETEDNMSLLLELVHSLNELYDKISRLNYALKK